MINENKKILVKAIERINALLKSRLPEKMEAIRHSSDIEKQFADTINRLIDFIAEISEFITPLSQGKLNNKIPQAKNFLASPFKELHSRLMHLTWQAQQITKGDYSQRVDFMGDFSTAFNSMIVSLEQKDIEIKQKIAQLKNKNKEMVYEINERKQTQKALQESEGRFRTILETIQECYLEVDLKGNLRFFNDSLCELLGYSKDELQGRNNREFTDKANAHKINKIFHTVYKTGKPVSEASWEFIRKDGTRRYIEASVALIINSKQKRIGFRGVGRDVTQRKQMEIKQEQLIADLQRALGEVKTLHGLLPICASCKKIRDDKGYWNQIESYIQKHSKAKFSHSICPECSDKLYGTEDWYIEMKENKKNGL